MKRRLHSICLSLLCALGILVTGSAKVALAQEPSGQQKSIILHPAPLPDPALRYRLLPSFGEQSPGNAATQYLLAFTMFPQPANGEDLDALDEQPVDKLDQPKARALVDQYSMCLRQVEIAAGREHCDWGIDLRGNGIDTAFPYLNPLRQAASVLRIRAKLQIAEGKFDEAIQSLKLSFAIVQHLRSRSTVVQGLVEANLCNESLDVIAQMRQVPGAPNLYWALANLPRPMIDPLAVAHAEQGLVQACFPALRGRRIEQLNADEMHALMLDLRRLMAHNGRIASGEDGSIAFAMAMAGHYVAATQYLVDHGRTAEQVHAMPVESVLAIYLFGQFERESDNVYKWFGQPYWLAHDPMEAAAHRPAALNDFSGNPLAILLPSFSGAMTSYASVDRRVAVEQCIEALRAYAAAHDRQLPGALADLSDTPAPIDPMTGKPFGYEGHGKTAMLRIAGIPGPRGVAEQVIQISIP